MLCAVALLGVSVALTTRMQNQWQLTLLWGVLVGTGTGVTSMVLAAIIANRWFDERRGLVLGVLSAANATGQLVFLPLLASLVATRGWRAAALLVAGAAALVFVVVFLFMRDRPEDLGLLPYGRAPGGSTERPRAMAPIEALRHAAHSRAFWILAGTFFVCGASTNGLIGTHLIAACHDYGIPEVRSAQLLAMMGIFDIIGTTASGWLTDRYSSRHLLFGYYTLRGISLLFLPFTLQEGGGGLAWFAVFYGLDWIATVPPTVRLTSEAFGRENTGRDLRMDWREPPARRVDGGIRRRRDPDDARRLPGGVLDRRRVVHAGGRVVSHHRPAHVQRSSGRRADARLTSMISCLMTSVGTSAIRSNLKDLLGALGVVHDALRSVVVFGYVGRWGGASRKGWSRNTRLSCAWRRRQASKCLAMVSSSWALRGEASCVAARLKKPAPSSGTSGCCAAGASDPRRIPPAPGTGRRRSPSSGCQPAASNPPRSDRRRR